MLANIGTKIVRGAVIIVFCTLMDSGWASIACMAEINEKEMVTDKEMNTVIRDNTCAAASFSLLNNLVILIT